MCIGVALIDTFFPYIYIVCAFVCVETTTEKTSPFLFPEYELVTEPEEEDESEPDTTKAEKERSVHHSSTGECKL